MTGTRLLKPERKVEKPLAEILPTIHNARLKQAKKVVKLPAGNNLAIAIACLEAGRVRIAEASLPTIKKTCPNPAKKAARLQVDSSPTRLINRPAVGKEADAAATLPMTAINHLKWEARMVG